MGFLSGISSFVKEHSDVIHGVLDVAGFIPGVGAVADAANAITYAIEGNWLEAGASLISAIPGFGDTFAVAKKSANAVKTGLKGVKELSAIKKAKGMKALLGTLCGKAKTGATKKLRPWLDKADEAFNAIKKKLKKECTGARCFSGDTLVYTNKGYQPIKEIQKGDDVFSRNPETGEVGFKEVEEVFHTTTHTVYHIWVNGKEEFKTTAYHPIYVEDQGWITAINLCEGDMLETADGPACITKIVKERHEEPVPMYNMHVQDWAAYFVGSLKVYVHNGKGKHIEWDDILNNGYSLGDMAEEYTKIVNSNKKWSWEVNIPNGGNLTKRERKAIKEKAIDKGLIPNVPIKEVTKNGKSYRYTDFKSAGVVKKEIPLPKEYWKKSDKEQFDWLNKQIGGKQKGYTWHHSETDGRMELVPFGIHNVYNHHGGRSKNHWGHRKGGKR